MLVGSEDATKPIFSFRDLGNSNLFGHLVPELGKLEHLQYLKLYENNIQGTIAPELGNLKSLVSLDLHNNNISGTIPPSRGKLKNLVFLRLNDNRLNGPIPREVVGISNLKVVDVSNNDLYGTIPASGPFDHIPLSNFENNPQLEGPELQVMTQTAREQLDVVGSQSALNYMYVLKLKWITSVCNGKW